MFQVYIGFRCTYGSGVHVFQAYICLRDTHLVQAYTCFSDTHRVQVFICFRYIYAYT